MTTFSSKPVDQQRKARLLLLSIAFSLGIAATAYGQVGRVASVTSDDPVHQQKQLVDDCHKAASVLMRGTPASDLRWAHSFILNCQSDASGALTAALRRARGHHDVSDVTPIARTVFRYRDGAVAEVAPELAGARDATPAARALGIVIASTLLSDQVTFPVRTILTSTTPMYGCVGERSNDAPARIEGTPIRPDAVRRLRAIVHEVLVADHPPMMVLNAALCAGGVVENLP